MSKDIVSSKTVLGDKMSLSQVKGLVNLSKSVLELYKSVGKAEKRTIGEIKNQLAELDYYVIKLNESNVDTLPPEIIGIIESAYHDMEEIRKSLEKMGSKKKEPYVAIVLSLKPVIKAITPTLPLYAYLLMQPMYIPIYIFLAVLLYYFYSNNPTVAEELLEAWEEADIKRLKKLGTTVESHASTIMRFLAVQSQSKDFNRYDVSKVLRDKEAREFWITNFGAETRRVETSTFIDTYLHVYSPHDMSHTFITTMEPASRTVVDRSAKNNEPKEDVLEVETKVVTDSFQSQRKNGWIVCSKCLRKGPTKENILESSPVCTQRMSKDLPKEIRSILHEALAGALDDDRDGFVSPADVTRFISYFGPLCSSYTRAVNSLVDLQNGIVYPWFYGSDLGAQDLEKRCAEALTMEETARNFNAAIGSPGAEIDFQGAIKNRSFFIRYSSHENEFALARCVYDSNGTLKWIKSKIRLDQELGYFIVTNSSVKKYYTDLSHLVASNANELQHPFIDPLTRITFNVSGRTFETVVGIFSFWPETLLSKLLHSDQFSSKASSKPYFIDRDPDTFLVILNWYRYGQFHYPSHLSPHLLAAEIKYYNIPGPYPTSVERALLYVQNPPVCDKQLSLPLLGQVKVARIQDFSEQRSDTKTEVSLLYNEEGAEEEFTQSNEDEENDVEVDENDKDINGTSSSEKESEIVLEPGQEALNNYNQLANHETHHVYTDPNSANKKCDADVSPTYDLRALSTVKEEMIKLGKSLLDPRESPAFRNWERAKAEEVLLKAVANDSTVNNHPNQGSKYYLFRESSDPECTCVLTFYTKSPQHVKVFVNDGEGEVRCGTKKGLQFSSWFDLVIFALNLPSGEPQYVEE